MATIPFPGSNIRHVRKTIAFDGGANNGNLDDDIPCFTGTGWYLPLRYTLRCTESLVCSAPSVTNLRLGNAGAATGTFFSGIPADATAGQAWNNDDGGWAAFGYGGALGVDNKYYTGNLVVRPTDEGGGADVTDGTLVIDVWYIPITDDGELEGDDIDIELDDYIAAAVWAATTRVLTALDEDTTTLDIDAAVRAALGLASANLDTQLGDLPTNAELATALAAADDAVLSAIAGLNDPDAAAVATAVWAAATRTLTAGTNIALAKGTGVTGFNDLSAGDVRDALGLASANLDTQLGDLPTNSELATAVAPLALEATLGTPNIGTIADDIADVRAGVDNVETDTQDIQGRLPASLVNNRMDATVDATGMETGAIDAILQRALTESYNADGSPPTVTQALMAILQLLTESVISGTSWTVKRLDGSTTAFTLTLNSATEPTSVTRSA